MALDTPITDELIESVSGIRGLVQNLRAHIGGTITLADLAGHRATLLQGPRFVGTGPEVADQMEEWFNTGACDGFVIAATHTSGRLRGHGAARRARAPDGVGCSAAATRAPPCATTWGSPAPSAVPMAERDGPAVRAPGRRRRHPGGRTHGGHHARRVRRRGHEGRTARGR